MIRCLVRCAGMPAAGDAYRKRPSSEVIACCIRVYESSLARDAEQRQYACVMRRTPRQPETPVPHRRRRRAKPQDSSRAGTSGSARMRPPAATVAFHAERVADSYAQEKRYDRERDELRAKLDRALRDARRDGVQHLQLAIVVAARLGIESEGAAIYKVEQALRQRASVAARRVRATDEHTLANAGRDAQSGTTPEKECDMSEPRVVSKTITQTTITYAAPEDPDERDHDLDEEDEGGDEDDTPTPAQSPTRSRRR